MAGKICIEFSLGKVMVTVNEVAMPQQQEFAEA